MQSEKLGDYLTSASVSEPAALQARVRYGRTPIARQSLMPLADTRAYQACVLPLEWDRVQGQTPGVDS